MFARQCIGCLSYKYEDEFTTQPGRKKAYTCNTCRARRSGRLSRRAKLGISAIDWQRLYARTHNHGISVEQFLDMVEAQEGRCAICKIYGGRKLNIDHCHTTGKIRGLLCVPCNAGLGQFKDDVALLNCAIAYITGDL